jgi:DNA-binding NarL/FixJ family response regulator
MADLPLRVAVVSPNPLVRAGLVALIAEMHGGAVVLDCSGVEDDGEPRDAVVYDMGAVTEDEARADLQALREAGTPVVALFYDAAHRCHAAHLTPFAITLSIRPEEFRLALERATCGRVPAGPGALLPGGLTEREFTVVTLIAEGRSNQQIADELFLSTNSVKTYVRTAYRKIGVNSRPAAILWALKHGLAACPVD